MELYNIKRQGASCLHSNALIIYVNISQKSCRHFLLDYLIYTKNV